MEVHVFAAQDDRSDDLVDYRWMHMGQHLRVVGSRNAVRLDIDLNEVDRNSELREFGKTQIQRIQGLVENTIRLSGKTFALDPQPFEIQIPWPEALHDGMQFSTNEKRSIISMDSVRWFERVDFFVRDGTLSIFCYFKPGKLVGAQNGSKWFPEDFRRLILNKAGE